LKLHDNNTVTILPIRLPTVQVGQRLAPTLINALRREHVTPMRGDILAVASKVVSTCEGRIVDLTKIKITPATRRLARRYNIDERLATIVIRESDHIYGGVKGFLLTLNAGILTANAGIDVKNSPPNTAILWPKNPDLSARKLRKTLERHYHTRLGVEVVDSRVTPLRLGTTGLAIGLSGFWPVRDERDNLDLYGRPIKVTQANVADDVAASAHLLMGEAADRIGAVMVRKLKIDSREGSSSLANMEPNRCLIGNSLE